MVLEERFRITEFSSCYIIGACDLSSVRNFSETILIYYD